jgi:hypothetical protein
MTQMRVSSKNEDEDDERDQETRSNVTRTAPVNLRRRCLLTFDRALGMPLSLFFDS